MGAAATMLNDAQNSVADNITLNEFVEAIKNGKVKNIICLAGAGISTSCGIPDFRSPKTGLYHNLQKYNLQNPEDIFSISYFLKNPQPFFTLTKELFPDKNKFKPSPTHFFIKLLADKGILLRHYTQNIDGLEVIAGVSEQKVVEAHGNYRYGTCLKCKIKYKQDEYKDIIMKGNIPYCTFTGCDGVIKPNVVFFGEGLPTRFFTSISDDFIKCDMLIIMGTSLKVYPFASLIGKVPSLCPRLLINMEHSAKHTLNTKRDFFLKGTCDDGIKELCKLLSWTKDLNKVIKGFNTDNDDQKSHKNCNVLSFLRKKKKGKKADAVPQIDVQLQTNDQKDNDQTTTAQNNADQSIQTQNVDDIIDEMVDKSDRYQKEELSPLGKTSLFMAAGRAIESDKNDAVFNDPYAKIFAGKSGFTYLKHMSSNYKININIDDNGYSADLLKYIVKRTVWIDNKIKDAMDNVFKTDIKQIVILGVGCDTRPYRLYCLQNDMIDVFELDLVDIIKYRNKILIDECNAVSKCSVKSLSVDFRDDNWINMLLDNGFNKNNDTLWMCEGLLSYLKVHEIQNLFKLISDEDKIWNKGNNVKNWIIGTVLNANTNKIWENKGTSKPHELLEKYDYKQYDIQPTGGKCKTYNEYLDELQKQSIKDDNTANDNFVPDSLAKSFFFLGMK